MKAKPFFCHKFLNTSLAFGLVAAWALDVAPVKLEASPVSIERDGESIKVLIDGSLFTEYIQGEQKPFLYPVIGPTGVNMSRQFPIKVGVPGESQDHPWQSSVYYAHGSVNGLDFWNDRTEDQKTCRIVTDKIESSESIDTEKARIITTNKWIHGDNTVMRDRTEITFSGDDQKRVIDYKITLIASEGKVLLGDTKEGCMAIRMNPALRVVDRGAKVVNSEGVSGKDVWGKKARWISYYNEIEGEVVGVALFDHPDNLRYPTTWHARDYGLCSANPFGLQYFMEDQNVKGDVTLEKGESLTFTHRFVFHRGSAEAASIDRLHQEWIELNR